VPAGSRNSPVDSQGDEPLAVNHDWWWPEDSEKLSKAMKEMGWYTFEKRKIKS